jgi:hypothetical protein
MAQQLAILVSSFDAYSDLWPPYFASFHHNWPDCPFPVYLLSNHKVFPDPAVTPILVSDVRTWPDSVRLALDQIKEEFILLLLEDLFIISKVDTERFHNLLRWIVEHRPACVKLQPDPAMIPTEFTEICHIPAGTNYRCSTVLSLWRKDVLRNILKSGESIWQFEIIGSARTDKYPDFYATEVPYLRYINGVIRGKWVPSAQKKLIAAGFPVQTGTRAKFSFRDRIEQTGRLIRAYALRLIPLRYQRRIRLHFSTTSTPSASR